LIATCSDILFPKRTCEKQGGTTVKIYDPTRKGSGTSNLCFFEAKETVSKCGTLQNSKWENTCYLGRARKNPLA
jgi:hypothetical protein